MKNIAILGAGWLGKSLALHLQEKKHFVKVSVRSQEKASDLKALNINAHQLKIEEDKIVGERSFFESVDVLIVSLTPQSTEIFKTLITEIEKNNIKKIILFSSTGIYADCEGLVNEESMLQLEVPKVKLLKDVEMLFLSNPAFETTVLRLAGLMGKNRHPVTFLAKKSQIDDGNEPVNMVDDLTILNYVEKIIDKNITTNIFNLVNDDHRTKEAFYTEAALNYNLKLAPFIQTENPKNRIVCNKKIKEHLK